MATHTLSALARIVEDGMPSFSLPHSIVPAARDFGLVLTLPIVGGAQ